MAKDKQETTNQFSETYIENISVNYDHSTKRIILLFLFILNILLFVSLFIPINWNPFFWVEGIFIFFIGFWGSFFLHIIFFLLIGKYLFNFSLAINNWKFVFTYWIFLFATITLFFQSMYSLGWFNWFLLDQFDITSSDLSYNGMLSKSIDNFTMIYSTKGMEYSYLFANYGIIFSFLYIFTFATLSLVFSFILTIILILIGLLLVIFGGRKSLFSFFQPINRKKNDENLDTNLNQIVLNNNAGLNTSEMLVEALEDNLNQRYKTKNDLMSRAKEASYITESDEFFKKDLNFNLNSKQMENSNLYQTNERDLGIISVKNEQQQQSSERQKSDEYFENKDINLDYLTKQRAKQVDERNRLKQHYEDERNELFKNIKSRINSKKQTNPIQQQPNIDLIISEKDQLFEKHDNEKLSKQDYNSIYDNYESRWNLQGKSAHERGEDLLRKLDIYSTNENTNERIKDNKLNQNSKRILNTNDVNYLSRDKMPNTALNDTIDEKNFYQKQLQITKQLSNSLKHSNQNNLKDKFLESEKSYSNFIDPNEDFENDLTDIQNQFSNDDFIDEKIYSDDITNEIIKQKRNQDDNLTIESNNPIPNDVANQVIRKNYNLINALNLVNEIDENNDSIELSQTLIEDFEKKKSLTNPNLTKTVSVPNSLNNQFKKEKSSELYLKEQVNWCQNYQLPSINVLKNSSSWTIEQIEQDLRQTIVNKENHLNQFFEDFKIRANVIKAKIGSRLITFNVEIKPGQTVKKITQYEDDIKRVLEAESVRILAPVPGTNIAAIEFPHQKESNVFLKDIYKNKIFDKTKLELPIGDDVHGNTIVLSIKSAPHILIAGATGSGKSVMINTILATFLLQYKPNELKLVLVDPKRVEFVHYQDLPHLFAPVVNDSKQASLLLKKLIEEMEDRYKLLASKKVRSIDEYNSLMIKEGKKEKLPVIICVIDELADLMLISPKDVEESIQKLSQKARASGIHLIVATQKPTTEVVTGVIKSNIPTRIAFAVPSQYDSRTILDQKGAESLIGKGDMLILQNDKITPYRGQAAFISNDEIANLAKLASDQCKPHFSFNLEQLVKVNNLNLLSSAKFNENDQQYIEAKHIVVELQRASTSLLQRRMRIGYNRAADLIDALEENGVIGPANGAKHREVFVAPHEL